MPVEDTEQQWRTRAAIAEAGPLPAVARAALGRGFVLPVGEALRRGATGADLRRLVRAGTWSRPRRGIVAVTALDDSSRPVLQATAAACAYPGTVIGGPSAAALYGVALLDRPDRPRLIGPLALSRPGVVISASRVDARERADWCGAPVTTPARTLVDLTCADRRAGLVAADSALAESLVRPEQLAAALARRRNRPGLAAARDVLALASPLSESPLESLTRLCLHDAGLPDPELQVVIRGPGLNCRVDFLFRAQRVVVEADGRLKYGEPGALWQEKLRQEGLEQLGYTVVRLSWAEVTRRPEQAAERVRRALARRGLRTA